MVDDAVAYFEKNEVKLLLDNRVTDIEVNIEEKRIRHIGTEDGQKVYSDFYVSAVPFFAFKKMFDEKIYYDNNFKSELLKAVKYSVCSFVF